VFESPFLGLLIILKKINENIGVSTRIELLHDQRFFDLPKIGFP
jgi:hypothetical protein